MKSKTLVAAITASLALALCAGGLSWAWRHPSLPGREPEANSKYLKENENKADFHRLHQLLARVEPLCWLFAGDSITHGCYHTSYRRNFTQYFEDYIKYTDGRSKDIVINTGNSGATTADMRGFFDAWIAAPGADVAFLCFGMNDCTAQGLSAAQYRKNLEYAVTYCRGKGIIPILQTPNTSKRQGKLKAYAEAVREIAREQEVLLVDNNGYWSEHRMSLRAMMSDAIHPNAAGHLVWARFLLQSLDMLDAESPLAVQTLKNLDAPLPSNTADTQRLFSENESARRLLSPYITNKAPAVWVFAGGTQALGHTQSVPERNYIQHFEEVLRWETANKEQMLRSKTLVNSARDGYGPGEILKQYEELIGRFHPHVVCLMPEAGTGEDAFREDLAALVQKAKASGAAVLLQTPPGARGLRAQIQEVGTATGTPVLDHTQTLLSTPDALDAQGALTPAGHLAIARDLSFALLEVPADSRMR